MALLTSVVSSPTHQPSPVSQSGSSRSCSRCAPARAMRISISLRVAAGILRAFRFAQNLRPVGIGDDQPRLLGKYLRRHVRAGGEIEAVGMDEIVLPFRVGAEILHRGFDLDDGDHAVAAERHQVGAAAGAQRHLRDQRQPLGAQPPADAAADGERPLRLPPVDGKLRRLRRRAGSACVTIRTLIGRDPRLRLDDFRQEQESRNKAENASTSSFALS